MRKFLRTILRILDGSPGIHMATRNRQRGQSMLELAFITPLLAILIAGASEVGWYTNRWLTLLEVTRVGARSATFLQAAGFTAPEWNDDLTIVPKIQTDIYLIPDTDDTVLFAENARDCDTGRNLGFYSNIACLVEDGMDPLVINEDPLDPLDADDAAREALEANRNDGTYPFDPASYDDIVISVFAIQNVNNARWVGDEVNSEGLIGGRPRYVTKENTPQPINPISSVYKVTFDLNRHSTTEYPPGRQSIVVGRYPVNANECNYTGADNGSKTILVLGDDGWQKDPFDYLDDTGYDLNRGDVTIPAYGDEDNSYRIELADDDGSTLWDSEGTAPEVQRGWALTGQHRVNDPNLFCFGSEFSVRDIEELINMPGFIEPNLYDPPADTSSSEYADWVDDVYASQDQRAFFEPQGMTLVEVFYHHQLLLDFPLVTPLQGMFGEGDIIIALWTAFPLPSVAPNITYQLP